MSEHKKAGVGGQTSVAIGANPNGAIWKKAKFRLFVLFGSVLFVVIIIFFIVIIHSKVSNSPTKQTQASVDTPHSDLQTVQKNLQNDTDTSTKIADLDQEGYVYETQKNYPQAVADYKQIVALDATDVRGPSDLLQLYASQKDKQNAITYANQLINILTANPNNPYASDLQYYQSWLKNIQANNFNAPKVSKDASAS